MLPSVGGQDGAKDRSSTGVIRDHHNWNIPWPNWVTQICTQSERFYWARFIF